MKTQSDQNHYPSALILFGAAAIVLLVFAWTFVR
jgi:hypothetical protein